MESGIGPSDSHDKHFQGENRGHKMTMTSSSRMRKRSRTRGEFRGQGHGKAVKCIFGMTIEDKNIGLSRQTFSG